MKILLASLFLLFALTGCYVAPPGLYYEMVVTGVYETNGVSFTTFRCNHGEEHRNHGHISRPGRYGEPGMIALVRSIQSDDRTLARISHPYIHCEPIKLPNSLLHDKSEAIIILSK